MEYKLKAKIQAKHQIGKKKLTETFQMTKLKLGSPPHADSWNQSPVISRPVSWTLKASGAGGTPSLHMSPGQRLSVWSQLLPYLGFSNISYI